MAFRSRLWRYMVQDFMQISEYYICKIWQTTGICKVCPIITNENDCQVIKCPAVTRIARYLLKARGKLRDPWWEYLTFSLQEHSLNVLCWQCEVVHQSLAAGRHTAAGAADHQCKCLGPPPYQNDSQSILITAFCWSVWDFSWYME